MASPDQNHVRIVGIKLRTDSFADYRVPQGLGLNSNYPVVLQLNKQLSVYALLVLSEDHTFEVDDTNRSEVVLPAFDLEALKFRFNDIQNRIIAAENAGRELEEAVTKEDAKRRELEIEINNQLAHGHTPE